MNDERELCQICYEKFDMTTKLPKKMLCCKNIICLKCLQDIYEVKQMSLCPICRCNTKIIPDQLPTDMSIFEGFLACPSCNHNAVKSELYYSFDTETVKCVKCQTNEMPLIEYVAMMTDDLSLFLKDYPTISNTCLVDMLTAKLQLKLDAFFDTLKKHLMTQFKSRIAHEINMQLGFDLYNNVMQFKDNIDKLNGYLHNMNAFINAIGTKQVPIPIPTLISDLNNYLLNKEVIIEQSFPFDRIKKYIKDNQLISLRKEINENEIIAFMMNIFDTDFSDKQPLAYKTGINYYDEHYTQLLNQNIKHEEQKEDEKDSVTFYFDL